MKVVFEPGDEEWLVDLIAKALEKNKGPATGPGEWMTTTEVSEHLRIPEGTLASWRTLRKGPPSVRRGRRVFYRRTGIDAWMENGE